MLNILFKITNNKYFIHSGFILFWSLLFTEYNNFYSKFDEVITYLGCVVFTIDVIKFWFKVLKRGYKKINNEKK